MGRSGRIRILRQVLAGASVKVTSRVSVWGAMTIASDTAVVMVTHDGEHFLRAQLESIFAQTELPAVLVVVDDNSRDGTVQILRDVARAAPIPIEIIEVDRSRLPNVRSRIAANVATGLAAAAEYDIVVLADQDDVWLDDRVARQRHLLRTTTGGLLVAGDGVLIDGAGMPTGGTLRTLFPAPDGWATMSPAERMHAVLRRPLVTGAASALVTDLGRLMAPIPEGWLPDRWASLAATARAGLVLDAAPVIRYRVHDAQELGVRQARTGTGRRRWQQVLERGASPLDAAIRGVQVVRRIRPLSVDPAVQAELSLRAILGSGLDRT